LLAVPQTPLIACAYKCVCEGPGCTQRSAKPPIYTAQGDVVSVVCLPHALLLALQLQGLGLRQACVSAAVAPA
jgi:hypothetical protein